MRGRPNAARNSSGSPDGACAARPLRSTVGYRSGIFADKLRQEGLEGVNLRGSIMAWVIPPSIPPSGNRHLTCGGGIGSTPKQPG